MLLDLHHDFADARGDFVRKTEGVFMPVQQKSQQPDIKLIAERAVEATSNGKPPLPEVVSMDSEDFGKFCAAVDEVGDQNVRRRMMGRSLAALGLE